MSKISYVVLNDPFFKEAARYVHSRFQIQGIKPVFSMQCLIWISLTAESEICFWYQRSRISLSEIPYVKASQRRGQQSCSFKPRLHLVPVKDIRIFFSTHFAYALVFCCDLERSFVLAKSSITHTGFVPAAASAQGPCLAESGFYLG